MKEKKGGRKRERERKRDRSLRVRWRESEREREKEELSDWVGGECGNGRGFRCTG